MFNIIKKWWNELKKSDDLKYLERATDLADLEHRQRQLTRRGAPFQTHHKLHTTYIRGTIY